LPCKNLCFVPWWPLPPGLYFMQLSVPLLQLQTPILRGGHMPHQLGFDFASSSTQTPGEKRAPCFEWRLV
jgi:hypothetical protein